MRRLTITGSMFHLMDTALDCQSCYFSDITIRNTSFKNIDDGAIEIVMPDLEARLYNIDITDCTFGSISRTGLSDSGSDLDFTTEYGGSVNVNMARNVHDHRLRPANPRSQGAVCIQAPGATINALAVECVFCNINSFRCSLAYCVHWYRGCADESHFCQLSFLQQLVT